LPQDGADLGADEIVDPVHGKPRAVSFWSATRQLWQFLSGWGGQGKGETRNFHRLPSGNRDVFTTLCGMICHIL
jgi:hypothetical protein